MGELASSSDVGAQIAALIMLAAREQKEAARTTRDVAEKAQCAAEKRELKAMEDEAEKKLVAGLISGGTQIAGGIMGAQAAGASSEAASRALDAQAKAIEGMGKAQSALFVKGADDDAAAAKSAGNDAARAKRSVDDARDLDKDAKEMLDRALSYYKEYLTAKSDTQRATLLRA